ncbi:S8 family serine peptidase [Patulibacter defluvii]|uniref:S8 family serine peptidase n=1 Tax=Patulibacter defluvii TaxID=3095358 RepID=UPI002A7623DD|nr:S8 family serine peptidase [Patulibacter sp. DM4]
MSQLRARSAHVVAAVALTGALAALAVPAHAASPPTPRVAGERPAGPPPTDHWIVQLDAPPLARHAATAAPPGGHVRIRSAAADAQRTTIDAQQSRALAAAAPGVRPAAEYRVAFSGFAARLSDDQATALRRAPGVRRVTRERYLRPSALPAGSGFGGADLVGSEPDFLGLPGRLWTRLGGPSRAGAGTVVGVIDTGVTPESASFAGDGIKAPPPSWRGGCESGEAFPASLCNNKLVGARSFIHGDYPKYLPEEAYESPRDDIAHGTHVAAIAVGNHGVDPVIAGNDLGVGRISGIAPAAHLAAYKACWPIFGDIACSDVDLLAAVDRAVADGVDVINLSLGGDVDPEHPIDPLSVALLGADEAGVVVVAAAGNGDSQGIGRDGRVESPASNPWAIGVGASTGGRTFTTTIEVRGRDGRRASAAASGVAGAARNLPIVDARDLERPGDSPYFRARHCVQGIEREDVAGRIVICETSRIHGAQQIDQALAARGAAGIVFAMPQSDAENRTTTTRVPSLHVRERDLDALRRTVHGGGASASFAAARASAWTTDRSAALSSWGPSPGTDDLLRPDVTAPGVGVLSAYAPDTYAAQVGLEPHERFAARSGTSMATPAVAGAAALLRQARPTWSPAAIRSALVTTAAPVTASDGDGPAPHVAAGGGRIDPTAAVDAGLVLAPTAEEYRRVGEALDPDAIEGEPPPLAPRDLNLPSVSLGGLVAPVTVARTVTSVADRETTWTATVADGRPGAPAVRVSPGRFTVAPGARQRLTIAAEAPLGSRAFGDRTIVLRDADGGRQLRIPVAGRNPGIVDPPEQLRIEDAAGSGERPLTARISGTVAGVAHGLTAPEVDADQVTYSVPDAGVEEHQSTLTVPPGTAFVRVRTTLRGPRPSAAWHTIVRDVDGDGVASASDVTVAGVYLDDDAELRWPAPGRYVVIAQTTIPEDGSHVRFDRRTWIVHDPRPNDPQPEPGLTVAGDPAHSDGPAERTFPLRWNGVGGDEPLLGMVAWHAGSDRDPSRRLGETLVEVEPRK